MAVERMHEKARALLLEVGFLNPSNPDSVYDDLRALMARAQPDVRETTILLGILRQLAWALKQEARR
jgi:tRNA/rRNA methyltransferase